MFEENPAVEWGMYEHSQTGNLYRLLCVGRNTETQEDEAVYQSWPIPAEKPWVRKLAMFLEEVDLDGVMAPRFRYLGPDFDPTPHLTKAE